MIIQIDTSKDSAQRLLQAAAFLERLAGAPVSSETEVSAEMFSMLDASDDDDPDAATAALASQLLEDSDDDDAGARVTPY